MNLERLRAADLPVGSAVATPYVAWIKISQGVGGAEGAWLGTGDDLSTYDWEPQEGLDAGAQVLRVGNGSPS